jgi:hypothetical protein
MKATVTAYKGKLVLDLIAETSDAAPGSFGQVIIDTTKYLGISKEAYDLLATIKPGRDSIGAVDWFESDQCLVFSWIGGPKAVVDPADPDNTGARGYRVYPGQFIDIPNDCPQGAKDYIDTL